MNNYMELVEEFIDYKGLDRLATRYYYAKDWDSAKSLYAKLTKMQIVPILVFDLIKWEKDILYKECRPVYFQEELLNEDIAEDKFRLILTLMRVYPCFMGYAEY